MTVERRIDRSPTLRGHRGRRTPGRPRLGARATDAHVEPAEAARQRSLARPAGGAPAHRASPGPGPDHRARRRAPARATPRTGITRITLDDIAREPPAGRRRHRAALGRPAVRPRRAGQAGASHRRCGTSTTHDRAIGWRVNDPHSHSAAIRSLYLHPEIHRTVGLVLGQRPIAIQSVYFEFGSEQAMHRDPMFVRTTPPSHFVAVWVALDDITEHNGPDPRRARAPTGPPGTSSSSDTIVLEKTDPETHAIATVGLAAAPGRDCSTDSACRSSRSCARAGEVLVWHGGLIHGGAQVGTPGRRPARSLLIHFSTADRYLERRANMQARTDHRRALEPGRADHDDPHRGRRLPRHGQPAAGLRPVPEPLLPAEAPAVRSDPDGLTSQPVKPAVVSTAAGRGGRRRRRGGRRRRGRASEKVTEPEREGPGHRPPDRPARWRGRSGRRRSRGR